MASAPSSTSPTGRSTLDRSALEATSRYHSRMLSAIVLGFAVHAAIPHSAPQQLVEANESFAHVAAFRIRADLHSKSDVPGTIEELVERQIEGALRSRGVPVTHAPRSTPRDHDQVADIIVDVHIVEFEGQTAVSWSFHVSQFVTLATGTQAFAATWIAGDLFITPAGALAPRLNMSLQSALDEFCAAYSKGAPRRRAAVSPGADL